MCEQPVFLTNKGPQVNSWLWLYKAWAWAWRSTEHSIIRGRALCLRVFFFFIAYQPGTRPFWSRLYGLNFISVSTEQCLLDWPVCLCSAAVVKSVKWETEEEGKSERQRDREGEEEEAQSHCNTTKRTDWSSQTCIWKTGNRVKCAISKDLYESTQIVFKEKQAAFRRNVLGKQLKHSVYLCAAWCSRQQGEYSCVG